MILFLVTLNLPSRYRDCDWLGSTGHASIVHWNTACSYDLVSSLVGSSVRATCGVSCHTFLREGGKVKKWQRVAAVMSAGAVLALTGCSVADPSPSQVALHYSNGPFSSQVFQDCVPQGQLKYQGVSDDHYYYPTGQRSFKFSTDQGSDFPPMQITAEGQVMEVSGTMAFTLDTSCAPWDDKDKDGNVTKHWPGGLLQKFHETLATQDGAYSTKGGTEPGAGWDKLIGKYVKDTTERAITNEALRFGWFQLFTDSKSKSDWERDVVTKVPDLVAAQMGAPYLHVDNILLQKPDPSASLKAGLAAKQEADLRSQAAEVDKRAALNFPGGIDAYVLYQQRLGALALQHSIAKAVDDGRIKAVPVPAGSPVIVNPGG